MQAAATAAATATANIGSDSAPTLRLVLLELNGCARSFLFLRPHKCTDFTSIRACSYGQNGAGEGNGTLCDASRFCAKPHAPSIDRRFPRSNCSLSRSEEHTSEL